MSFLGGFLQIFGGFLQIFGGVLQIFEGGLFWGGVPLNFLGGGGCLFGGVPPNFRGGVPPKFFGGVSFFWGFLQIFGGGSPPEYGQRSAGTHPTGMHSCMDMCAKASVQTFVCNSILLTGLEFNCTVRDFFARGTGSSS